MNVLNHCCGILLWVLLLTIAQCAADCMLENFKRMSFFDANFELSFFKLICTTTGWDRRGDRCKPATCGHPGDVQFADFRLVSGKDYEFGSQVLYTCHKGYQMTSRTNTLNCLEKGWDGHLPECEPIPCPSITVKDGVLVNGDIDQPTSGRVIQFRCRDRGDALVGQAQIFCDENGVWSDEPPYCQEISCPKPPLDNFQIEGEKTVYKQKESLRYECNKGYIKVDGRPSVCQKSGLSAQWIPAPQCEPITCKLSSNPPEGTDYDNQGQNRFRPGESVRVVCGDKLWVKNTELWTAELTCDETGQWDFDPVCQKSCDVELLLDNVMFSPANVSQLLEATTCKLSLNPPEGTTYNHQGQNRFRPGESVWVVCGEKLWVKSTELQMAELTCERQDSGTLNQCVKRAVMWSFTGQCKFSPANVSQLLEGQSLEFQCINQTHMLQGATQVTCLRNGQWSHPFPTCTEPRSCGSPPSLDNGDFFASNETFDHNSRVEYHCKVKYTMQGGPHMTCINGEWTGNITCLKPCTVPPDLMGPNKIGFRYSSEDKLYAPHNDYITFHCVHGATHDGLVGMLQICKDGVMPIPKCV
ncbi:hypothetical protein WMY93_030896 [Mugilogobius chulae]|uniref:Sushi domain-containing protein n=1 Tax=Mugilogobius chulae TaxID=88201 RepID=A0AAW0MPZ7_9GOBI